MNYNLYAARYTLYAAMIAYLLDLIFGDPAWRWHPVRIIGRLIAGLEKWMNVPSDNKIFRGFILALIVTGAVYAAAWSSLRLAWLISPVLYFFLSTLLIYFGLSVKDLAVHAHKVKAALADGDVPRAREQLAMIVGRDTDKLDEPEIVRASVETVGESAMDGIVAPLFYCFLGGPALMWVYKAINTLDSMVGHRNRRFIEFGRVCAKLDAMMNFIPARLTSFLIGVSGGVCGKDFSGAFRWGFRYFLRGPEYNSRMTEAAMAGALGVRLGGTNYYQGAACSVPFFGDNRFPLNMKHIGESIRIAYICSGLAMILGIVLGRG
jgi:adenosylcobinamide-phosphate synthase